MKEQQIKGIGMTSQRTRDRLVSRLQQKGIRNSRVLEVMRHTPRHLFVDEALSSRAYEDTALPIGHRQTISQPYIVARMTEVLLEGSGIQKVLEIGTGSGYQAALLAQLVPVVYTVERIAALVTLAQQRFRTLGLGNIRANRHDGGSGWVRHAPYDAIMVTAAPTAIPEALLEQLSPGGRLVIPVGSESGAQKLELVTREGDSFNQETIETVSFVPLVKGVKQ